MTLPNFKAIELPKRSVKYFMIIAGLVDKQTDFQPIEYSKIRRGITAGSSCPLPVSYV